jgi:hypothetical protein
MWRVLGSEEWTQLEGQLKEYVSDFGRKVIPYERGFQM